MKLAARVRRLVLHFCAIRAHSMSMLVHGGRALVLLSVSTMPPPLLLVRGETPTLWPTVCGNRLSPVVILHFNTLRKKCLRAAVNTR